MVTETTLETVLLSSLVDNDISTGWFDYSKPNENLKQEILKEDGTVKILKRLYVTEKGALTKYPNHHVLLNGKNIVDIIKEVGKETQVECNVVPGITDDNIKHYINSLNKERNLKDWEKCEKALSFLEASQQGKDLGGKTRWLLATEKAGVDISEDTLERYHRVKEFDKLSDEKYLLMKRIKGIDLLPNQETMTIAAANTIVSRHKNKEKLRKQHPDKKILVDQIYTDLIQDFHAWQQDNREPWMIDDESIQLVFCSPHYLNQRKYTPEEVEYKPQTLQEYLNDLLLAFTEAKKKLKKDGVLVINIADTQRIGQNYMVIQRFCLELADKLGLLFIFKQIWCKSNGLAKGYDDRCPTYDYEEILYFAKSKDYYFKPIEINNLEKDIVVGYYSGRQNRDASKSKDKWMVSKEYETFNQFIHQTHFEDIIITGTASAESREITKRYKVKHPAVMPLVIPLYPILCFSKPGDIVMDPWAGTGTTLKVALATGRKARGIDLEQGNVKITNDECQRIVDIFK